MYELCVTLFLPPGCVVSSQPSEKYIPKDEAIARGVKNPPRNVRTVFNSSDVVQRRKFTKGKQRRNRDDKLQLRGCLLPDSALSKLHHAAELFFHICTISNIPETQYFVKISASSLQKYKSSTEPEVNV